jgi:hypothetical protein
MHGRELTALHHIIYIMIHLHHIQRVKSTPNLRQAANNFSRRNRYTDY